ncbi:hypothetical protein H0H93_007476 [Arthromyces matolae]|nr:hypothetical protein H0H93_007476 [Arthromyces matolae]
MPPSYLTTYKAALDALSARTRTPLPSLLVSFALLHELTAVVPLVAVFYGSRSLGIGDTVISTIINNPPQSNSSGIRKVVQTWVEEGDAWAARIGRRYGVFGYEKRTPGELDTPPDSSKLTSRLAGDVANAVVAYGVTKPLTL